MKSVLQLPGIYLSICYKWRFFVFILLFFCRCLSGRKIESIFRHFTKLCIRKMDSSQNSLSEKWILHKIHYQKNGFFTKFIIRKIDTLQNSMTALFRLESLLHFLRIPFLFKKKPFKLFLRWKKLWEWGLLTH